MESSRRAVFHDSLRELPNLNRLNGEGEWHALPRASHYRRRSVSSRRASSRIPILSSANTRGPPLFTIFSIFISFVIILLTLISPLAAQISYSVSGEAYDAITNEPIDSLTIKGEALTNPEISDSGFFPTSNWSLSLTTVSIKDNPPVPSQFLLSQNYPNPFNPTTKIPFNIPEAGLYTLKSFNILGQEIASLKMNLQPGSYEVNYGFGSHSSGLQIVVLEGKGYKQAIKLVCVDGGDGTGFTQPHKSEAKQSKKIGKLGKTLQEGEITVLITAEKQGYQTSIDTITLQPGSNHHDLQLRRNNYNPILIDSIPDFQIAEDETLKIVMNNYLLNPDNHTIGYWIGTETGIQPIQDLPLLNPDTINIIPEENYNGETWIGMSIVDLDSDWGTMQDVNIQVTPVNDPVTITLNALKDTLPSNYNLLPAFIGALQITDPDTNPEHALNLESIIFNYDHEDSVTLHICNEPLQPQYVLLDSITPGFTGTVNYSLTCTDNAGAQATSQAQIHIRPPLQVNVHFLFKAMYADTVLTSGTSTLTYRRMLLNGSGYEWAADSLKTSENGEVTLTLEEGLYDVGGLHTESLAWGPTEYTFLTRPGTTGVVEQRALDDDQSPILFNTETDTIIVYKLMSDFPMFWMIEYASKGGSGTNIGTRRFGNNDLNPPAWWNLNYMAPDSLRRAWTQELIAELQTIPHVKLAMQYLESTENPGAPLLSIAVSPGFPSPGTNGTGFDPETHEIIIAEARYPPWPSVYTFKIEILQAIGDLEDYGGINPDILDWDDNGNVYINDLGRRIFALLYLADPKTKF